MMIDLGETQILEWQMPQACHRLVGRQLAPPDLLEKFVDRFGVQNSFQPSAFSIQPARD